jgi:hypothetical protein
LKNVESKPRTLAEALNEAESRNGSLDRRLLTYRRESERLRPDFAKVYDELIARLGVLDRGEVGPKVGESLPEFSLPDEQSGDQLQPRPLVPLLQARTADDCLRARKVRAVGRAPRN